MGSDLETALAFAARRQAVRAMSAARWSHVLSFQLGWMNPGQAHEFVARAVHAGLLARDGDVLRLVVDPQAIDVPRGFRPRLDPGPAGPSDGPPTVPSPTASADEPDLFLTWVARLAAARGWTREAVLAQVADAQRSLGGLLTAEAAILLLARRAGIDVADAAGMAAKGMLKPSRIGAAGPAPASSP